MIRADLEARFLAALRPLCDDFVAVAAACLCAHVAQGVARHAARKREGDALAACALFDAARDAYEFGTVRRSTAASAIADIEEHARDLADQLGDIDDATGLLPTIDEDAFGLQGRGPDAEDAEL